MPNLMEGFIIGFAIAAPLGPIGVLIIQQTLQSGLLAGLVAGFGVAVADLIYGFMGAGGLAVVAKFLMDNIYIIQWLGGLFLCGLGMQIMLTKSSSLRSKHTLPPSYFRAFWMTFLITMTNPVTIISFAAVFAATGIDELSAGGYRPVVEWVLGLFCGSLLWWMILSYVTNLVGKRLKDRHMIWVRRASGFAIIIFGVIVLLIKPVA